MKYLLNVCILFCCVTVIQAQTNKKTVPTPVKAQGSKDWKPTKGDTRNPFDTITKKQTTQKRKQANNPDKGKKGSELLGKEEMKRNPGSHKKDTVKVNALGGEDDPWGKGIKQPTTDGLGEGEDPWGKTNVRKAQKKTETKTQYANQEVSYAKTPNTQQAKKKTTAPVAPEVTETAVAKRAPTVDKLLPKEPKQNYEAAVSDNSPNIIPIFITFPENEYYVKVNLDKDKIGFYKSLYVRLESGEIIFIERASVFLTNGVEKNIPIKEPIRNGVMTKEYPLLLTNTTNVKAKNGGTGELEQVQSIAVYINRIDGQNSNPVVKIKCYLLK